MPTEQLQECEVAMLAQIRLTHTYRHIYRSQLTVNPVDDAVSLAPAYRCQDISMHTNTHARAQTIITHGPLTVMLAPP